MLLDPPSKSQIAELLCQLKAGTFTVPPTIGVLGLGVVGQSLSAYLLALGAKVRGFDQASTITLRFNYPAEQFKLILGEFPSAELQGLDLLCLSPGVDPQQKFVQAALAAAIPVCGELEVCHPLPGWVLAITGTNGKSTTTTLAGKLAAALGLETFVGGNLGEPVSAWLLAKQRALLSPPAVSPSRRQELAVLELSSFQLETAYSLQVEVGVVLNVTPDHGERYVDHQAYAQTKEHLVRCVRRDGLAILNLDDPLVAAMESSSPAEVWWFSKGAKREGATGGWLEVERKLLHFYGRLAPLGSLNLAHPRLCGQHNLQNAAAAFLAVLGLKFLEDEHKLTFSTALLEQLQAAYQAFPGLAHRLEIVETVKGVTYINDSKATNDQAASVALKAMEKPVVLLLGGRSKHGGYQALLAQILAARGGVAAIKALIAFGEAEQEITSFFKKELAPLLSTGEILLLAAKTLAAATHLAATIASPEGVVLLAPACASFDEFKNYQERGESFKTLVRELSKGC